MQVSKSTLLIAAATVAAALFGLWSYMEPLQTPDAAANKALTQKAATDADSAADSAIVAAQSARKAADSTRKTAESANNASTDAVHAAQDAAKSSFDSAERANKAK